MPTLAEKWIEQGREEGFRQGLQQGRLEGFAVRYHFGFGAAFWLRRSADLPEIRKIRRC